MRITFLLFASMAAATTLFCNGGTEGNGDCENNKLHTYCCSDVNETPYVNAREVTVKSEDRKGRDVCTPSGTLRVGRVFCAP
ncbi:extracellular protein 9-4 [Colletotrichum asianum]